MSLRAKLAAALLLLLVLTIVVVSGLEIDRSVSVMVGDLRDSGTLLINQTFEQIRAAVRGSHGDPIDSLGRDRRLQEFLESSRAFGRGVVYARIERPDGSVVLAGEEEGGQAAQRFPAFAELERAVDAWWPLAGVRALWGDHTFEMSHRVEINGEPAAVIKVGLSTGLIAAEVRRSVENIVAIAALSIVLSLGAALLLGTLLLRPVAALAAGFEQLAAGRAEVSLPVTGHNEFSSLAEKFNRLSHQVKHDRAQWESERDQFFNIFRSIRDAMLLLDAQAAVLFANDEALGQLGMPAGGRSNGKPLSLLLGKEHPLVRMVLTSYAAATGVNDVALELGDDKNSKRLLVSIFPLGRGPQPPGLLVIARDLKPVQELENVVDYSGRLARLGALVSGVAHQIRNPLNAISLQLELLDQQADDGHLARQRARAVRQEVHRLERTVEALLRFMRPEQLKLAPMAVNELIGEIADRCDHPGIRVERHLDPAVDCVQADRALLSEALTNLAKNAEEAMPQGGTLTFASALVGGDMIEISVIDQGKGIAAENLDSIFNLYFTTKESGSGLGLSLALRAVDLHHGTIAVDSKVGQGTTLTIRLPVGGQVAGVSSAANPG